MPGSSAGTLRGITASFTGSAASADDVYHYTDEFAAVAAISSGRTVLHDIAGTDWIDMAAMTGDVVLTLSRGTLRFYNGAFL